jgi:small subunit ribosomal protein MRP21
MELRSAIQFASRTARLGLNNISQCRALNNPARFLSTTRTLLAERPSSLPPRPQPAAKTSWIDLPTTRTKATPDPTPIGNPFAGEDGDDILSKWNLDINDFKATNNLPTKKRPVEMRHLRPSTGRTIERSGNVDVARAFQMLGRACATNKVAKDFRRQLFHERPGLKRKRLKSERWRARFKVGFRATVQRVSELRAQGW